MIFGFLDTLESKLSEWQVKIVKIGNFQKVIPDLSDSHVSWRKNAINLEKIKLLQCNAISISCSINVTQSNAIIKYQILIQNNSKF